MNKKSIPIVTQLNKQRLLLSAARRQVWERWCLKRDVGSKKENELADKGLSMLRWSDGTGKAGEVFY